MSENIVVIGAGQAGLQIAESLRAEDFEGGVTLLGNEPLPPYQRPPLSKAWLQGETTEDRLIFRGAPALEAKRINLRLGSAVTEIDRAAKTVAALRRVLAGLDRPGAGDGVAGAPAGAPGR